jgi:Uma2 family endonuclease
MLLTVPLKESRVLLRGIRWPTYERILADVDGGSARLTYDRGELEIVSPSERHERLRTLIDRLLGIVAIETGVPIRSGGSTTFRDRQLQRGIEPDACYWVQSEVHVRARPETGPDDPPPDLAIEVEVSRSSLDRLRIYAALGVGEVWRCDGREIAVHVLDEHGDYATSAASRCFPWLPMASLAGQVRRIDEVDEVTWMRAVRDWVRTVAPRAE